MIQRCTNPLNKDYKHYGGRGITVCDEWTDFSNFVRDMGDAPKGLLLDRENNDKGYLKGNCKWATKRESALNRRMTVRITHDGRTLSCVEWAEALGISKVTIAMRIKRGETNPSMILSPVRTNKITVQKPK